MKIIDPKISAGDGSSRVVSKPLTQFKSIVSVSDTDIDIDAIRNELDNLKRISGDVKSNFDALEKRQDKAMNFMMGVATVIIIGFFLASMPLFFDYYQEKSSQYENFTKRIDGLDSRMKGLENKWFSKEAMKDFSIE